MRARQSAHLGPFARGAGGAGKLRGGLTDARTGARATPNSYVITLRYTP